MTDEEEVTSIYALLEVDEMLRHISERDLPHDEKVKQMKEVASTLIRLQRPWRWMCLRELMRNSLDPLVLDDTRFWSLFTCWWDDCEANLAHRWMPTALATARTLFRHRNAIPYLDPDDRAFFDLLPESVSVYRGVGDAKFRGISWTTDREVAGWFAWRFSQRDTPGYLLSGRVRKSSIIAAFSGSESEVICLPRHVHGRKVEVAPHRDHSTPAPWDKNQLRPHRGARGESARALSTGGAQDD